MTPKFIIGISAFLFALILIDVFLMIFTLVFPDLWFEFFHGTPREDPQGLLTRTGAVWSAFTLWQIVAWLRWKKEPYWLVVIAGVRLTEVFGEWAYLYAAESVTWAAKIIWGISPPSNLLFGVILIWAYKRAVSDGKGS